MDKLVNFLRKWATGRIVAGFLSATLAIFLTMMFFTLPAVRSFAPEKVLFDLSLTGYSYEYAISLLDALGPAGRHCYLTVQLPLDFIYPGLFIISYSLLLTWVFRTGYASDSKMFYCVVFPILGGLFDYLENICIILMITSYPNVPRGFVTASSTFTILKSGFTTVFFILVLVGIVRINRNRSAPVPSHHDQ